MKLLNISLENKLPGKYDSRELLRSQKHNNSFKKILLGDDNYKLYSNSRAYFDKDILNEYYISSV